MVFKLNLGDLIKNRVLEFLTKKSKPNKSCMKLYARLVKFDFFINLTHYLLRMKTPGRSSYLRIRKYQCNQESNLTNLTKNY